METKARSRGRTSLLISIMILIAVGFTGTSLYFRHKVEKEKTLIFQLEQLRKGVQISLKLKGDLPENLESMISKPFGVGTQVDWKIKKSDAGKLVDPFGSQFGFDRQRGWVYSTTKGYETW